MENSCKEKTSIVSSIISSQKASAKMNGKRPKRNATTTYYYSNLEINNCNSEFVGENSNDYSLSDKAKKVSDKLFEPTIEMMIDDFDDERTLDEEEALAKNDGHDPVLELSDLQKESDMPIEQLLALYKLTPAKDAIDKGSKKRLSDDSGSKNLPQYHNTTVNNDERQQLNHRIKIVHGRRQSKEKIIEDDADDEAEEDEEFDVELNSNEVNDMGIENYNKSIFKDKDSEHKLIATSNLKRFYSESYEVGTNTKRSETIHAGDISDEDEEDIDYLPDEDDDFKKTIMVGNDFQAHIPEGLIKYSPMDNVDNFDTLIWLPYMLSNAEVEKYLLEAASMKRELLKNNLDKQLANTMEIPCGNHLKDDEIALYMLQTSNHDCKLALHKLHDLYSADINCGKNSKTIENGENIVFNNNKHNLNQWSEEECRNFENGLRTYGKDFHTIQYAKVQNRTVGELVEFYYLWKKTERHDVFANKARLDKKKYNLHPGLTDYMDRFLEEQENCIGGSSINISISNNPIQHSPHSQNMQHQLITKSGLKPSGTHYDLSSKYWPQSSGVSCLLLTDSKRLRNNHNLETTTDINEKRISNPQLHSNDSLNT